MWHTVFLSAHWEAIIKRQEGQKSTKLGAALQYASDYMEPTRTPRERREDRYNTLRFTNQWSSKCLAYRGHRPRQGGRSDCQQGPRAYKCIALFPVSITNTEKKESFLPVQDGHADSLPQRWVASSSFSRLLPQPCRRTRQSTRSETCQGEGAVGWRDPSRR